MNSIEKDDEILHCVQNDKNINVRDNRNGRVKPCVLFVGGIHAREDFSVMLCMKMIDYYCYYYNEEKSFDKFDVRKIIDNVTMYFVPVVNPDGLNIVRNGLESSSSYEQLINMYIWGEDHTF